MQIGPIFRALMRNKTGTFLLVGQIALTLSVLMNAVALMLRSNELITLDTGIDQSNLIVIRHAAFDAVAIPDHSAARALLPFAHVVGSSHGRGHSAGANGAGEPS